MAPASVAIDKDSHTATSSRSKTPYSTQLPAHASRAGNGHRKKDKTELTREL
jgi:hypothetical protein